MKKAILFTVLTFLVSVSYGICSTASTTTSDTADMVKKITIAQCKGMAGQWDTVRQACFIPYDPQKTCVARGGQWINGQGCVF